MNSDRWATSIHEAGHAVAAIALGGQCTQVTLQPDTSGMAFIQDLLYSDDVVATAAGPVAEKLLADTPAPEQVPTPESFDVRPSIADLTPAEKLEHIAAKYPPISTPSDARVVAEFCIRGVEDDSARWIERHQFILHRAEVVVRNHADKILRVARELFARGILTENEIEEAMK